MPSAKEKVHIVYTRQSTKSKTISVTYLYTKSITLYITPFFIKKIEVSIYIPVGEPTKKLNSVYIFRYLSFTEMYFSTNLLSNVKKLVYINS